MTNYNNGKIYKIEPINGEEGDIYIGSTTKDYLSQRMTAHRGDYGKWKNGKHNYVSSYDLFDKYGIENCKIILLENCNCESKDQLIAREAYYIKTLKCVNRVIPKRTRKEYRNDNKVKILEYREANKEKRKEHYKLNKIEICMERKIPYNCQCGGTYRSGSKAKHFRSKKHLNFITNVE